MHFNTWSKVTQDRWILETITGYKIEVAKTPKQQNVPKPLRFNKSEQEQIDIEIENFLLKGIVEQVTQSDDSTDEFISNIFIRPKKDGRFRVILNLKQFNEEFMDKKHFKMETLKTAIESMRQDCYFASVDLADAYYSIPIAKGDRRFFRFFHKGQKFQFTALVMGLTCSPRIFTKVLKPVFAHLRALGHISTAYIDDSCLIGLTYNDCLRNISDTVSLMDELGLTVHTEKSVLKPSKQVSFLGFVLCSESMTVRLTEKRCQDIIGLCVKLKNEKRTTIRFFAKVIGKLVASEPGVEYAMLYIKPLEIIKEEQLLIHKGNFDSFMNVSLVIKSTLDWWVVNLPKIFKKVSHGTPKLILYSDSSNSGWGAYNKTLDIKTGGDWSVEEQRLHINILELKACQLALLTFCKHEHNIHVQIFLDNSTSVSYVNKLGGKKPELNALARSIWFWCIDRNIHLTAAHVAGVHNTEADKMSRKKHNDDLEWSLDDTVFRKLIARHPNLEIDLFASRLNHKLSYYVSRYPEPDVWAVDAFSLTWSNNVFYIFPPFSLIPRILQKLEEDKAREAVLLAPIWTTQIWWPCLVRLICGPCYLLPNPRTILKLPHKQGVIYPLNRMRLAAFHISGESSRVTAFQRKLPKSLSSRGNVAQRNNITHILQHGISSAKGQIIPLIHL
ncbi:MAG: hypothetical protein JAZ03_08585 [Candidatus Thiodiazotropha taylori]|nr:hypothetical protein [Candidatus Thiodiazotropha taylori]MCG8032218.1 hypothetical protein [Candidatus Thiodiazotropha taylori]MCW4261330.1 reverse transcriptase domain-containing protein [Candidatus Thiodiazotropha endolucinida]MCW4333981.1 reverse transcriptase domain-containing protein [Candidatus Thiodiazotropha endolucinida]